MPTIAAVIAPTQGDKMSFTESEVRSCIESKMYDFRSQQLAANDQDAYLFSVAAHIGFRQVIPQIVSAMTSAPTSNAKEGAKSMSIWQTIMAFLSGIIPTLPPGLQSLLSILLALLPAL